LLAWPPIARSPGVVRLLRHITDIYFAGRGDELKEYTIAVDAFGRPPSFDSKRDSVVRVEAHRLRKALKSYYDGPGANTPVRLELPLGSYVPVFRHLGQPPAPVRSAWRRAVRGRLLVVSAAIVGAAVAIAALFHAPFRPKEDKIQTAPSEVSAGSAPVRIDCGSEQDRVDSLGQTWLSDRYYIGGRVVRERPRAIRNTSDPDLYLQRREGEFEYSIPLAQGVYQLHLHFAETQYGPDNPGRGGENSRVFSVLANGAPLIPGIDVLSDAGGSNTATIRVFKDVRPTPEGYLRLAFRALKWEKPILNGIEVLPGTPKRIHPIRITTANHDVRDSAGRIWQADRYYSGGLTRVHHPALESGERELFASSRFGHFTYTIPVALDGAYTLRLLFSEQHFGPGRPGGAGVGRRVFHVFCNGEALLRDFDLLAEAPPLRPITKVFRRLKPSAQSKLVLQFVPVRNYATVNAIEVLDETPR
jgi:hypothetical protein